MLQAPTGMGKTLLAAAMVEGAQRKSNRVLFVVPAVSLIDQTVEAFFAEGLTDIGVIQANHPLTNPARSIQIASVQTLQNRDMPFAHVAIIDEAHRWYKFYQGWFARDDWQTKPIIGLSATPWTKGLGRYYDDLLIAATTSELIDGGYLSKFRVFAPSHPDLTGVRTVAGDYHEGELGEAMRRGTLTADIVQTYRQRWGKGKTLCFAVDRLHAKHLQEQFEAAGVRAGYIDAFTPIPERKVIERQLHAGEIEVVCNVGCLTTGIDWDVRCIVMARPTKSEMLFVQIVGRGLRTATGKDDCLILDHSDNHIRLGFVTDIQHEKLDDGSIRKNAKTDTAPMPKECPQCAFLRPPKVALCPACGFRPQPKCTTETEAGELLEITRAKVTMAEKQVFYSELLSIQDERSYKPGWAANQYRSKFDVWPNQLNKELRRAPSQATRDYVRSRMIAYAKRRPAA
jgi:superfamily II DNA or RNA helicase